MGHVRAILLLLLTVVAAPGCGGKSADAGNDSPQSAAGAAPVSGQPMAGNAGNTEPAPDPVTDPVSTEPVTPAPVSDELSAACKIVANTWCRRLAECSPVDLETFYATQAICQAAAANECETRLTIEGVNRDPKGPQDIATRLDSAACSLIETGVWVRQYTDQPGSRALGVACTVDTQCGSLYCETPPDATCGTCKIRPNAEAHADEPCTVSGSVGAQSYGCSVPGLDCQISTETCVIPRVGGPCVQAANSGFVDWERCGSLLECHDGTCIEPLGFGAACSTTDDHCMRRGGLACNAQATCDIADRGAAHVQGQCGGFQPNGGVTCGYDDICTYADPNGSNDEPGNCIPKPVVGLGDQCDTRHPCPLAMSCSNGTCQTSHWADTCESK